MAKLDGYQNEWVFVNYLNGKKISRLNLLFRDLIDELYPNAQEDDMIKSWKNPLPQKADIFIEINGVVKGISIKMGGKNSVHVERITDFIHFLIENRVEKKIVIEYLKYHYADGSTNGKGGKRLSVVEYKEEHQEYINQINCVLNQEKILLRAIDRFVLKGNNAKDKIDAIVYGTVNDFLWITANDIKTMLLAKRQLYSSGVHFSLLSCQPKNRCLNYNPKYEKDRFCVQIKWYNLGDNIIEWMNEKYMQKVGLKNGFCNSKALNL